MSSREIAELTGKDHKNVLADIRKMLVDLEVAAAELNVVTVASVVTDLVTAALVSFNCHSSIAGGIVAIV